VFNIVSRPQWADRGTDNASSIKRSGSSLGIMLLLAVGASLAAPAPVSAAPAPAVASSDAIAASKAPTNPAALKKSCTLWFNYTPGKPMDKAPGHSLLVKKTPGRTVNYRYNWDAHYAVVSTWSPVVWGFMNRTCLGAPAHHVGGRLVEHLPKGVKKYQRWMCGQQTLYVRDHQQRVIGRLYHGERFVQYGPSHTMTKDHGRISIGYAFGHVQKAGRVYTKYLSPKPC
jgi:hypothetical protein